MNWDYISGFFDADGSITLSKSGNSKNKTISITFTNVYKDVLIEIGEFIKCDLGIKGFISRKPAREDTHQDSYQLQYVYFAKCIPMIDKIRSIHPKKKHRFMLAVQIFEHTLRNGKYTEFQMEMRQKPEKEFFN